jgi:hypothetical protein
MPFILLSNSKTRLFTSSEFVAAKKFIDTLANLECDVIFEWPRMKIGVYKNTSVTIKVFYNPNQTGS